MARDIEEFLRRAAERRKKQLKQKQAGQPPRPLERQPPPPAPNPAPFVIADEQVEVVRQPRPELRNESVVEHVRRHMDTSDVVERASHLAENLEQTDERLEARLRQQFDHELGTLRGKRPISEEAAIVTATPSSPLANDLVEMLRSPQSIRQAVLIAEVLKRPSFLD